MTLELEVIYNDYDLLDGSDGQDGLKLEVFIEVMLSHLPEARMGEPQNPMSMYLKKRKVVI